MRIIAHAACSIVLSALLFAACRSGNEKPAGVTFAEDRYKDSMKKTGLAPAHTSVTVSIEQMKFQPDNITIGRGDTVVFVNHDMVEHDVTEETTKAWHSSPIAANASWKFVPEKSADYFCSLHPVMKGKITVQ